MKKLFLFLVWLLVAFSSSSQSDWRGDIEVVKSRLPENHIDLFFQLSREQFFKDLDDLSLKADKMDDCEIALSLQQIITRVGDSHTTVDYPKFLDQDKRLPLKLYWFDDGIYVLSTTRDREHLLGSRLDKIGGHPMSQVIDSLSTLIVQDNPAFNKTFVPWMVTNPQILAFFGLIPKGTDSLCLIFTDINGNSVEETFQPGHAAGQWVDVHTAKTPLCLKYPSSIFWGHYFPEAEIYYIQYNSCSGSEAALEWGREELARTLPSFREFTDEIFDIISHKPVKKFIFDMRYNGGGSSGQGTRFIEKLSRYENINRDGVLYVIVGRKTFSSAIINTMNFKDMTKATVVGEQTGGMPNHYGEVRSFSLPYSGLEITYSTNYFRHTDEDLKTITPDIEVDYNFADYLLGVDPYLDAALKD